MSSFDATDEPGYLELVRRILTNGQKRSDRTGVGTLSLFGESLAFDLRNGRLPLLTCKRVNYRAVLVELLWFLSGSTDSHDLERQGVDIWKAHATRDNLDRLGFRDLACGQLGPIYGHQWRHAAYDQIEYVLNLLRNEPTSRRILINSWNVSDLERMVLPPCHVSFQMYVSTVDNSLSGLLYLRSSDVGLGLPFNIASYATLLHLLAKETDRTAHTLKVFIGDAHIYNDHVDKMQKLLQAPIYTAPTLTINDRADVVDLSQYSTDDFVVHNYISNDYLPLPMAV